MNNKVREAVAPLYLLLCLLLGGSAQGMWSNMILQLLGIVILAWAAIAPGDVLPRSARLLFGCAILGLGVVALQLVPLPPSIWPLAGGRRVLAQGYDVLGLAKPWFPLSTTPYESLATLFALIPALAMIAAILRIGCRPLWLVFALVTGTMAGIILGALQVGSADPTTSPWYLYEFVSYGFATGFFANANHMATLLLVAIPYLVALLVATRGQRREIQRYSAVVALVAGAGLVLLVGLVLNQSLAGYGLAVPVVVASAAIVLPARGKARRWFGAVAAILLAGALVGLTFSPLSGEASKLGLATSVQSRQEIFSTTARAARDFMPFGSGLGSFQRVYALYEDHQRMDPTVYVNHAHNDYLELALETGIPGIAVMLVFVLWWGRAVWRVWNTPGAEPYARAASIASAAILVHSIVDFPLRTAAISACFAMSLALLVYRRGAAAGESDLRPARHVVIR